MSYYFGNDYGGVAADRRAGEAQDSQNYFNLAHLLQGQDQQDFANQLAVQSAITERANANRNFNWAALKNAQDMGLHRDVSARDWARIGMDTKAQQAALGNQRLSEQDSLAQTNALLPLADNGTLDDLQFGGLLPQHQMLLKTRRDAARASLGQERAQLGNAANLVDRETQLKHYIAQSQEAMPGPFTRAFQPSRFGRMRHDVQDWQKELTDLTPALTGTDVQSARKLPIDPESGFRVMPSHPWMQAPAVQPATAPLVAPSLPPVPSNRDLLVRGQAYMTARGPAIWDGSKFTPR